MYVFFLTAEFVVIGLIMVSLFLLLSGDASREQKLMIFFLYGSLVQNVGYVLEMTAGSMDAAILAVKVEYLGSIFVPLLYCSFIHNYCYRKMSEKLLRVLLAIDVLVLLAVFTCDKTNLYYSSIDWVEVYGGHSFLQLAVGPMYVVFFIFSCGVPLIVSVGILFNIIIFYPAHAQVRQYKRILLLELLPFIALLLKVMNLTGSFDPTPVTMGLMLSTVQIFVWSRRNYDFRYLAAEVVLQSISGGVLVLDAQRRIVSYNRTAQSIFSDLGPHILGDNVEKINGFREEMLDVDHSTSLYIHDRYYECQTQKMPGSRSALDGYTVLILDVTATRNYIEEIKRIREQAEQANKAKSAFLANMSHEIRTPMNAIIGLSDILMEESQGRKLYAFARDIKSSAQNLLGIINDILDLSKVEAGKMELVFTDYYVNTAVGEVVGMMEVAASLRGLELRYECDTSIPCRYHGDEGRIRQILINLLNNAVKFTKKGYVKITVSGSRGASEDEELLKFEVQDTGCGIRKEDLEKIFDNFQQVDSKQNRTVEGTGLGLSITKKLVELMNGNIHVESVYGAGSTFTVTIPQTIVDKRTIEEMPDVLPAEVEQLKLFTAEEFKILLVDDNAVNRKVAKRLLDTYKFDLTEAASGPEAIDLVKKRVYDLIFMDHMMPEMDGIEAVQIIRSQCGENGTKPVVIALTANVMAGEKERFLKNGFQDFLPKPLDRKSLNNMLAKWVPDEKKKYTENEADSQGNNIEEDEVSIWGIDVNLIIDRYPELADYKEILNLYCIDSERKLKDLREFVESGDFKSYEIEVHALKSASANIGAAELSDLAKEHEMAASRGNETYVLKNYEMLLQLYEKQVEYIQKYLKEKSDDSAAGGGEELPQIGAEELIQRLKEALGHLERFRSKNCLNVVEELLKSQMDQEIRVKLEEIREQLKLYEDDHAEELLQELINHMNREE